MTNEDVALRALVAAPVQTRRLYPRGGFEGLEANALQVLIAVRLLGEPLVGELVAELLLAQGTVSTALGRLRKRGLVTSKNDDKDGRGQRQRVSAQGEMLLRRFIAAAAVLVDDE
jgi:DNA-binding MarR family transcriptional regulator